MQNSDQIQTDLGETFKPETISQLKKQIMKLLNELPLCLPILSSLPLIFEESLETLDHKMSVKLGKIHYKILLKISQMTKIKGQI
jgi:hypothetical protein